LQNPWGNTSFSLPHIGLQLLVSFGLVLPLLGGGGSIGRTAREFAPPRVNSVRRTAFYVAAFVSVIAIPSSFLYVAMVPGPQAKLWAQTPLSALAQFTPAAPWLTGLITLLVPIAAFCVLIPGARAAMDDGEQLLRHLSVEGLLPGQLANAANIAAASVVLIVI